MFVRLLTHEMEHPQLLVVDADLHTLKWTKSSAEMLQKSYAEKQILCRSITSTKQKLGMNITVTSKQVHCKLRIFKEIIKMMICFKVEGHSAYVVYIQNTPCCKSIGNFMATFQDI